MKTMLGWLGDPFLHLFAIAAVVLVIGSRSVPESSSDDNSVVTRCAVCHKVHDLSKACRQFVTQRSASILR